MSLPVYLLYSNSSMPLSPLIRLITSIQSREKVVYSHVALVLGNDPFDPDCLIIESSLSRHGVRFSTVGEFKRKAKNWELTELEEQITEVQKKQLLRACEGQLYKGYDLKGIIGLGVGRNWEDPTDWWCSELVAYLLKTIGMLLNGWGVKVNTYTPHMCRKWSQRVIDKSVF